jgi:hypothetical protein
MAAMTCSASHAATSSATTTMAVRLFGRRCTAAELARTKPASQIACGASRKPQATFLPKDRSMASQPGLRTHLQPTDAQCHFSDERRFRLAGVLVGVLAMLDIASAIVMLVAQG